MDSLFNFGLQVKINNFLRDEQEETQCHFPWARFNGESGELCPQGTKCQALPSQGRAQPCHSCREPRGQCWLLPRASSSATASLARRKSSGLSFSQRWNRAWGGNVSLLRTPQEHSHFCLCNHLQVMLPLEEGGKRAFMQEKEHLPVGSPGQLGIIHVSCSSPVTHPYV